MKIKKNNKTSFIPYLIIDSFLVIYLLKNLTNINKSMCNIMMLSIGFIGLVYTIFKYNKKKNIIFTAFILCFISIGLISSLITDNLSLDESLWSLGYGGISIILLNIGINSNHFKKFYYTICVYFFVNIYLGFLPEQVIKTVSRNNISVIIILFLFLYYIACYEEGKTIPILPAIYGLIINLWAVGRGGIISILVLCIGLLLFKYRYEKINFRNPIVIISLIIVALFLMKYIVPENLFIRVTSNFDRFGMESSRDIIWETYINKIKNSVKYLLFGVPYYTENIFTHYNGNLHNSFLILHSNYGMGGIFLISSLLIKTIWKFIKRKHMLYLFLIIIMIIRSFTDAMSFSGPFDILWYYFMFKY